MAICGILILDEWRGGFLCVKKKTKYKRQNCSVQLTRAEFIEISAGTLRYIITDKGSTKLRSDFKDKENRMINTNYVYNRR